MRQRRGGPLGMGVWVNSAVNFVFSRADGGGCGMPAARQGAGTALAPRILDRLTLGVMVVDAACEVLFANRAAETMLGPAGGLVVEGGVLTPLSAKAAARLMALVTRVVAMPDARVCQEALPLPRRNGRRPLLVTASALTGAPSEECLVLLLLVDPDAEKPALEHLLQRQFGLSRKEAHLAAALVRGRELRDIAQAHDVSLATVRTQLRSVLRKTQTGRQAELVALIAALPMLQRDR